MKVIVVGINHAGTSAIRTLLSQNNEHEVIAFDRNDNISFLGCGIALTIGGVVKNTEDLFYSNKKELEKMGAKIHMNTDVTKIDPAKKEVEVVDLNSNKKSIYKYDKLIYAAGSWPINLGLNMDIENVEICKLYQHAMKLIEKANDPSIKTVTIVGAGYIGLELVEAFHKKGKKVNLIDFEKEILSNYTDKQFSKYIEDALKENGINLFLGHKVESYVANSSNKLKEVRTNKATIPSDLVIQCTGFAPNTSIIKGLKKSKNKAIIVDQYCRSSNKDIYAIGDCCAIYDASTKKYRNIALATNAVKTGIVAASNINKINKVKLESIVGTNALCIFGINFSSTGLCENSAKKFNIKVKSSTFFDNDRPEWMNEYGKVGVKIIFEEKTLRLVGAQIISFGENNNHSEWIFSLALAIQKQMSIIDTAFTDVYFLPHYNKPFNFVLSSILSALGFKYIKSK